MRLSRTAFSTALLLGLGIAALAAPADAASSLTARSSGTQAVLAGPGSGYPILYKLHDQQRVYVLSCTRHSRWCEIEPVGGGPEGWVSGSYLIGSGAKNAVTPFEFTFNPLDPLNLYGNKPPKKEN